ncbi:uncharacterized protein LOC127284922 [Leptopilina boulardi]|uniref:uncharacterized protein LOC127284922 n=1 Tax=Leptopilina boulardi TaxID=63433 RepID=UPI0021F5087F|nr:uncharacterized protein LOC127284922 [Leptopilina boulardi]
MFYLILWNDKSISVVEDNKIKEFKSNNMVSVKWGRQIFEAKIIAQHDSEDWLNGLTVSSEGIILGVTSESSGNDNSESTESAVQEIPIPDRDTENDTMGEVHVGNNFYITELDEKNLNKYIDNPKKMVTTLLICLVGKEKLRNMSRSGKGTHEAIPEALLETVERYVFNKCSEKLSTFQFKKCVTKFCSNLKRK